MALSFSRPDPASPASVSSAQFPTSRRGFDQSQVRDFLRMVAAEQARLQERERFLERELRAAQNAAPPNMAAIDEDTAVRLLGEEAARVLQTAREAAAQIRARAEDGSARLLREATDEAQRLREEAEIEAARRRQDAAADSEAELQMAKQQGRDMVNEARSYRERVLSELARRRELARQQIEQLIHGRDRLLQAFERSRLAAVEVMAELTPLGDPNEYVGFQPTTGPVPTTSTSFASARLIELLDSSGRPVEEADVAAPNGHSHAPAAPTPAAPADVDSGAGGLSLVRTEPQDVDVEEEPPAVLLGQEDAADIVLDVWPAADLAPAEDPARADEPHGAPADAASSADATEEACPHPDLRLVAPVGEEAGPDRTASAVSDPAAACTDEEIRDSGADDLFARLRAARAEAVALRAVDPPSEEAVAPDAASESDATSSAVEPDVDESIVPLIVSASRKLKRVLADEQNELLDTLRRKEPVRAIDALLPWESEQTDRYAAAVHDDLVSAAVAGARGNDDGRNPAIVRPASDAVTNEIVAPLRDRLVRCIDKADGNNSDLGHQVRSLYREWKTQYIDEHVEEIVRLAYDRGALTVATG